MLKATDQGHKAQVFSKIKKVFAQKNSQICCEISGVLQKKKIFAKKHRQFSTKFQAKKKKGQDFSPFLTNQKIVLSSTEAGHLRGLVSFEAKNKDLTFDAKAKDFKICPRSQGRPQGLNLCYDGKSKNCC